MTNDKFNQMVDKTKEAAELAKLKMYQTLSMRGAQGETLKPHEVKLLQELDEYFNREKVDESGPPEVFKGWKDALDYIGVSKRTLHVHIKSGLIKQNPDGSFPKAQLDNYLRKYPKKNKSGPKSILNIDQKIKEADLKWRKMKVRREKMLVQQLEGTLIAKKEVHSLWAARVAELSSALEILADRIPPLVHGKTREEMYELIKQEVWELRNAYSRGGRYCPEVKVTVILKDS